MPGYSYQFYSTFTTWPKELRGDLRSGVKAEAQENYKVSEAYFRRQVPRIRVTQMSEPFLTPERRALDKAKALTPEQLGGQYHLKVSGIAIALAAVLEKQNNIAGAYEIYARAFADILRAPLPPAPVPVLSGPERMRAVGLAMKLGEIASRLGQKEEEERYLVFGVEEILRMMKETSGVMPSADISKPNEHNGPQQELILPSWIAHTDAGSVLERLAEFYSRTERPE